MKPTSSLFAKILSWFFLNIILVAATLAGFFAFQSQINLHAVFGQQGTDRLRTAGMLIAQDLARTSRANWPDLLSRHAAIHQVDFSLVLKDGAHFSSANQELPATVMEKVRDALQQGSSLSRIPRPHRPGALRNNSKHPGFNHPRGRMNDRAIAPPPHIPPPEWSKSPHLIMHTQDPTRHWSGIQIALPTEPFLPPSPAFLLAVSDSITGNGFFFDPLPWMAAAAAVIVISVLFWIPMVRHITRPLGRMTRATEAIARGRFDVAIHEPRADEIGRLAKTIRHMTERLSGFVKGQKRFLGDVAHELGSPVARIQFGLGALEQRVERKNRQRVRDVMEDVDHMSNLVGELLAFSRADMKSNTVKLEKIDLLPVVQTAVKRETTPTADIVVRIDPGLRVMASAELLTRALANLIRNAVKYTECEPIDITAEKKNGGVEIVVRDRGTGVPEELIDRLFEPFFRPEASRDRDSGGVGLGMAIVKTCVETCRGSVSAANLEPVGFAVTIRLNA